MVVDLLSRELYGEHARHAYEWMRREAPVYFDEQNRLWGVATYEGVMAASRDSAAFSNAGGSRPGTGPMPWMIDMDGSAHLKRRKIVSRGFTPAAVRASVPWIERLCDELIDEVCERGSCDLVRDLAAPLPMIVIGDMLGVAPADRDQLLRWSDDLLGSMDGSPERIGAAANVFVEYGDYARRTIAARRESPTEDLVSVLVHAEVDGDRLADDEIAFESLLILVGGDETTRHVISGGIEALLLNPDERGRLADDDGLLPTAVEEMLRWVSPIKNMARTVTRDVELEGIRLSTGDKVVLLYESANFDEAQFEVPQRFDVRRSPNDHLAFGFGAHFCLGASLARLEVQTMVERVLRRLPDLELAADKPLPHFLGGITEMPVRFHADAPVDLELTDDQEQLRRTVRRFLEEPSPSWSGLVSLGLTGILVPEEHGGVGMGMVDMGVVLEEMGRAVHPGPFLSSAVGAVSAVRAMATPSQQAELLPRLADGTAVGTVALLEPGGRYEWRSPATRAAGDRLSGTKVFVADADAADLLLVVAAADDGLGLFAVEGAEVEPTETVDGTRRSATVTMDRVPATRLGTGDVAGVVDRLAAAYVADAVGAAERVMELAVEYAKERIQFDRPIGSFQAVQHLCADMLRDVELARAGSWYALWALDAADPAEAHRAVTMAKAFASDALPQVGAAAIQVFGGVGFTWEHDAHRFYKRLLTMQHALGGPAEQLDELATIIL